LANYLITNAFIVLAFISTTIYHRTWFHHFFF